MEEVMLVLVIMLAVSFVVGLYFVGEEFDDSRRYKRPFRKHYLLFLIPGISLLFYLSILGFFILLFIWVVVTLPFENHKRRKIAAYVEAHGATTLQARLALYPKKAWLDSDEDRRKLEQEHYERYYSG